MRCGISARQATKWIALINVIICGLYIERDMILGDKLTSDLYDIHFHQETGSADKKIKHNYNVIYWLMVMFSMAP